MRFFTAFCAYAGLILVCALVAAVILAAGGNLVCHAERAGHGVIVAACQSPLFSQP